MILGMIGMRQQIKAHSNGHSMSWKSPGFHWNPLKDLKRFSLHISRFLFTPSLLFTYTLCTMQHMLGPIMTMSIILSHVKTRGIAGGRSVGVAFFQPPSNIIQTHSNVIQNLKPQKISVKKVCLLFPTEILLNVLAQNLHGCGFPCGIGFLCGRSECGSQPLLFASAAHPLPKTALS